MREEQKNQSEDLLPPLLPEAERGAWTYRPCNPGAEKWLERPIKCLDQGFVYLVDYMGNDEAVARAARVSYGKQDAKDQNNERLIRYLRRHMHTSPFEMVEFKFHCKLPIFVARQWIRHRTANVNEYSGRYSQMIDEFYVPKENVLWRQSTQNKQGGGEELLNSEEAQTVLALLKADYEASYSHYQQFLSFNLRRELARIGLSLANYTQWYWKIDLHNLLHFLRLRMDKHAQYEIRVYAEAIAKIVKDAVPICWRAFEDYVLNAVHLSAQDVSLIRQIMQKFTKPEDFDDWLAQEVNGCFANKREAAECLEKLRAIGLI